MALPLGPVAELVGIEAGVVSGYFESPEVEGPERGLHDQRRQEAERSQPTTSKSFPPCLRFTDHPREHCRGTLLPPPSSSQPAGPGARGRCQGDKGRGLRGAAARILAVALELSGPWPRFE